MNIAKAPVGGLVSKVNGQFYEGGEFMPISGLFCGKKGQSHKKKWDIYAKRGKSIDLGGSQLFEVIEYAGGGVWDIKGYAICDDKSEAIAQFTGKTKLYAKSV